MKTEVDNYISELQQTVIVAGLNYDIWWVYEDNQTRPLYFDAMNRYTPFFQMSIHAHFIATLVALYRLYETRPDTFNIPSLLSLLRGKKDLPPSVIGDLEESYKNLKPLWVKVSVLRNKAFAHRAIEYTISDVFREANAKPDDLCDLIEGSKDLLNQVSRAWSNSGHAFNLHARDATIRLLDDLNRL